MKRNRFPVSLDVYTIVTTVRVVSPFVGNSYIVQVTVCFLQPFTISMEKDKVVNEEVHRIRITLTSTNVKAVEKGRLFFVCS